MSTIKIGSQRELEKFLKILAEESVTAAQASSDRAASMQKDIISRMRRDKAALSEEDPEKTPPEKTAAASDAAGAEAPAPAPVAKTPKQADSMDINPTLDNLMRAINEMRSGFGTNDSSIEAELSKYFDRLEDAEKVSLIVMLRSLGNIMRKEETGDVAPEPSQYDVVMSMKAKEKEAPSATPASTAAPAAATTSPEGEDTTPPVPIQVGKTVSEAYRNKIRNLLKVS